MITELNERSREVFKFIVDAYMETGEPVGSRTISNKLGLHLSAATIRNVMADLEDAGLLYAPHTSAGRLPTDFGLRLFIDGMMEVRALNKSERARIKKQFENTDQTMSGMLEQASTMLSGLSSCAGLVVAPKTEKPIKHIQFIELSPGRLLVILVSQDGMVENRVIETGGGYPPTALMRASNYLTAKLEGRTLGEARKDILQDIKDKKSQIDKVTQSLVEQGVAVASPTSAADGYIIVRGQQHLLSDIKAIEELEKIRTLFETLENRNTMLSLLDSAQSADGVQIFIGAENRMFDHAGLSTVVSPYKNAESEIIGAIGVIGPTRLNYGRIIPIIDYTSKILGQSLDADGE